MSLRNTLNRLLRVVLDEAERNPRFEALLVEALSEPSTKRKPVQNDPAPPPLLSAESKRGKNRRDVALIDPIQAVREGEAALRIALGPLSLEQLRDIVAEYGMDQGRLVMKWTTPERIIDRIVEMSVARAHKGNAFRKPVDDSLPTSAVNAGDLREQIKSADQPPPEDPTLA